MCVAVECDVSVSGGLLHTGKYIKLSGTDVLSTKNKHVACICKIPH